MTPKVFTVAAPVKRSQDEANKMAASPNHKKQTKERTPMEESQNKLQKGHLAFDLKAQGLLDLRFIGEGE